MLAKATSRFQLTNRHQLLIDPNRHFQEISLGGGDLLLKQRYTSQKWLGRGGHAVNKQ